MIKKVALNITMATVLVLAMVYAFAWQQITYKKLPDNNANVNFIVTPGTSLQQFTRQLQQAGIFPHARLLRWYAVLRGYANNIKAGEYNLPANITASQLLQSVVEGKVVNHPFTIVEGWRTSDLLAALQQNPKIKSTLVGLTDAQILVQLGISEPHLEGIFLPDTYYFSAETTDVEFLQRAYKSMQEKLRQEWDTRGSNIVLQSPYEALILASIIEKESATTSEYHEISGVYQRRLAKQMRLQADPTVIYGLGPAFNGQLVKSQLQLDTPYNTYTRNGLPPTPIAIPSMQALNAALHPTAGDTLYFVARGDGSHEFSKDLEQHNRAVKKYRD